MHHRLARRTGQQSPRRVGRPGQKPALPGGGRPQGAKPRAERTKGGRPRRWPGRMKAARHGAENPGRLVVAAVPRQAREVAARRARHQQGFAVGGQDPGRAPAVPPDHGGRAVALLLAGRHLEHRRRVAEANRGKAAAERRLERLPVGTKVPQAHPGRQGRGDRVGRSRGMGDGGGLRRPRRLPAQSAAGWLGGQAGARRRTPKCDKYVAPPA